MKTKTFFTSDLHLQHSNIIKYCNRPFIDAEEMDETIIRNWNNVVQQHDTIWVLGDVTMTKKIDRLRWLMSRLKGNKHLIKGNHDFHFTDSVWKQVGFQSISPMREIKVREEDGTVQKIVLCHYAMRVWPDSHYGSWQLYGHSHGTLPDDPNMRSVDVGVDCHNFTPVSYEELKVIMSKKNFKPIDHHTGRDND